MESTLKIRSLLSEIRAKPPLKCTVQVKTNAVTAIPIILTTGNIGNQTTGTAIGKFERERNRANKETVGQDQR